MIDKEELTIPDRRFLLRLLLRVAVYYMVLGAAVYVLGSTYPAFLEMAPVGGVSELSGAADPGLREFEDAFLNDDLDEVEQPRQPEKDITTVFRFQDARSLFFSMLGALLLMLPVSWVYKGIHRDSEHDQSLDETTLILPAVVAGIVMVVQHSLALAFSLAGIVAAVLALGSFERGIIHIANHELELFHQGSLAEIHLGALTRNNLHRCECRAGGHILHVFNQEIGTLPALLFGTGIDISHLDQSCPEVVLAV